MITRMGTGVLGGITVWLRGESGTSYYYAHLTGYAPGIREGLVVEAGTVLGYVGNDRQRRRRPAARPLRGPPRRRRGDQPVPDPPRRPQDQPQPEPIRLVPEAH